MMKRFLACAAALALAACTTAYYGAPDAAMLAAARKAHGKVFVIDWSLGGTVTVADAAFLRMALEGVQVHVVGTCASACILVLRHRNVCYAPGARFVFHGVTKLGRYDERASRRFEQSLPKKISEWSAANGAMSDPGILTTLTGTEVARLDDTDRTCPEDRS